MPHQPLLGGQVIGTRAGTLFEQPLFDGKTFFPDRDRGPQRHDASLGLGKLAASAQDAFARHLAIGLVFAQRVAPELGLLGDQLGHLAPPGGGETRGGTGQQCLDPCSSGQCGQVNLTAFTEVGTVLRSVQAHQQLSFLHHLARRHQHLFDDAAFQALHLLQSARRGHHAAGLYRHIEFGQSRPHDGGNDEQQHQHDHPDHGAARALIGIGMP